MNYVENKTCLVCDSDRLFKYLDLSDQPLANSYHKGVILPKYPLQMNLCTKCFHSQLSVSVEPKEMFQHYLYISDTTKTLTDYFKWVTSYIISSSPNSQSVLEIACNSGLLLEMFQHKGYTTYGVDPAENLRELSKKRDLNVFVDYWTTDLSNKFLNEVGKVDLILAFHVLPHVPNPNEFLQACNNILSEKGKIFIQTSQCDMFLNNEFDVIYHEHSSYFTGRSIRELAHRNGFYVSSIIKTDIHSKSFLFSLQKKPCEEIQLEMLIQDETKHGIYTIEKYNNFADKAIETKNILIEKLDYYKSIGYTIIGYGAAAKGNTLLNYLQYKLDYIIDDNEMKQGFLTPGMDIEIHGINLLEKNFEKICFVPLAWNFFNEIKERIVKVRNKNNDLYIKYFPKYSEEVSSSNP